MGNNTEDNWIEQLVPITKEVNDKRPNDLKNHTDVMKFISDINSNRLQFGGDATIGKGIVNVNFLNGRG